MARLAREDWIEAGLQALQATGYASLKADTLARAIGVTRGSFYWHFADLDAFHQAVLEQWRNVAFEHIVADLEQSPGDRLERLLRRAFTDQGGLEVAVRAWAIANPLARAAVDAVDGERVAYLRTLIIADGIDPEIADGRARALNWSYLGISLSTSKPPLRAILRIVQDLLAFVRSQ